MQDIKSKTNKIKENLILNTYIDQILLIEISNLKATSFMSLYV